jgi:hypothetical protein
MGKMSGRNAFSVERESSGNPLERGEDNWFGHDRDLLDTSQLVSYVSLTYLAPAASLKVTGVEQSAIMNILIFTNEFLPHI